MPLSSARHHATERSRRQAICARTLSSDHQKLRSRIGSGLSPARIGRGIMPLSSARRESGAVSLHRAQPKASDLRENVKFRSPEAPFANWVRAQPGANWVQAQPATTFCGLPCWKARMLSSTICMQRRRACSGAQAMCGVTIQCGCSISGEPYTGGSSASTSMAA